MNLMKNGVACYVETGAWSKKAIAEAKKYGEVQKGMFIKERNSLSTVPVNIFEESKKSYMTWALAMFRFSISSNGEEKP